MPIPARALAAIVLAAALCLSSGCTKTEEKAAAPVKKNSDRKPAPEFSLKDADGRTVTLADYKGKVVLLNFWATWCGPCKIEIPWFIEFEQKYKDRGFAVLGVAMDEEGFEVVKPYLEQAKVNYRVVMGNDSVATLYGGVDSLPTSFVLDQDGRIASTHVGLVSKSDYENDISQLLDGRAAGGDSPEHHFGMRLAKAQRPQTGL
ncbi:MAG TPA: TlpA disulfide reductase family protein [Bryobacteraceae bacterium]|nr:TlpA disulfide reductase family protein [Bryobacteraceae bacterium]